MRSAHKKRDVRGHNVYTWNISIPFTPDVEIYFLDNVEI